MNYTGKEYASKATAGTALGFGIGGTALALLSNNNGCGNNGLLGGLFGNNNGCYVTEKEAQYMTALAIAQSEKVTAETTKQDSIALFQELRTQDAKIADGLIQTGNAVGVLNAQVACLQKDVERNREESFRNLAEAKGYTDTRVTAEAELRKCEDEKVVLWAKGELAQKVNSVNKIDIADLCGPSPLANGCSY